MRSGQCRCGRLQGCGRSTPPICAFCKECGTTVEMTAAFKTEQRPHRMIAHPVEMRTDDGVIKGKLTRCIHCLKTKSDLAGEPMLLADVITDFEPTHVALTSHGLAIGGTAKREGVHV